MASPPEVHPVLQSLSLGPDLEIKLGKAGRARIGSNASPRSRWIAAGRIQLSL
jgi:hypothetical protein